MPDKTEWIAIENDFMTGDVIRWTENIWSEKKFGRKKSQKPKVTGKQAVTGQIEEIGAEFITIKVLAAEVTESTTAKAREPYKPKQVIRKKAATLIKGNAERLPWSDEEARAISRGEKI